MSIEKLNTKLVEKRRLTKNVWWLELEFAEDFNFKAGQYVSVKINKEGDRRAYSIASVPEGKKIGLLVDVAPGGEGSKYFLRIKVGDKVEVLGPLGRFVVESLEEKLLFVATGSGIAPMKSMIEDVLQNCRRDSTTGGQARTRLVWGLRFEKDIYWKKEFDELKNKYDCFQFDLILSKPSKKWQGNRGHIIDVLEKIDDWKDTNVYLCGGSKMVEETEKWLLNKKIKKEKIYFEKYG